MLLEAVTTFGNHFNKALANLLKGAGWRAEMIGYGGIGSPDRVRVLARALMSPTPFEEKFEAWVQQSKLTGWQDRPEFAHLSDSDLMREAFGQGGRERGERGWRQFMDAQIPFQPVVVTVGKQRQLVYADRGGYVDVTISGHGLAPGWHMATVAAADPKSLLGGKYGSTTSSQADINKRRQGAQKLRVRTSRPASVPVRIVGTDELFGVVSDVDDTVMISWLPRPLIAAKNAFFLYVSSRQAVPGMSYLLQRVTRTIGTSPSTSEARGAQADSSRAGGRVPNHAPVAYISTGAWNVAPGLRRFLSRTGFPTGTPLLSDWGPSQTGWFRSGPKHKRRELEFLTNLLPWVRWVLVGDDGQHDPLIYSKFARDYPHRVAAILIRTLTPTQQVLSHGSVAAPERVLDGLTTPVFVGPDGYDLLQQLRANQHFVNQHFVNQQRERKHAN
ncbi:DUF2183 domain-containing protein [Gleimia hominis]|uniref:DUF2183 domain-containing protein n=1 Tax=Gleimia hominis TaxID=595468 RepID=A0ABU3I914_9ACTO|nr:phosphatase domain-containing protein [Gleimia hominis]MDT3766860.1 DUF2183 domain-containing protein [Gleimia hominis]